MANNLSPAEQVAAQKAKWAADKAARLAREKAQMDNYRANQPIPLYGIGKGMDVYYAPGQKPGASRTEANGREVSGYWDPRTNKYVPANWKRPVRGQTLEQDGRTYYGGKPPDWMMPGYTGAPVAGPSKGWSPNAATPSPPPAPPPPSGGVPLPPGSGPQPLPPPGQQGNPYIGMPPPNQPPPGAGGNKVRQPWYHVQPDPMAAQLAMADALRTG